MKKLLTTLNLLVITSIISAQCITGDLEKDALINGTLYYTDGSKYIGQLSSYKPNGKGKYWDKDGKLVYDGEFKDGNFMTKK